MFTFTVLYLLHYIFIFFYFFLLVIFITNIAINLQLPLAQIGRFISSYTELRSVLYILLLSLAGFPPFTGFFLKTYLLLELCKYSIIYLQILLVIFFFISTIFYLQTFNIRSLDIPLPAVTLSLFIKNFLYIKDYSNILYSFIYHFFFFLLYTLYSIVFFCDLILIISSF